MTPEDREIPISLRGIGAVLLAMNTKLREPASIRQIKEYANLSMRVTTNILYELRDLKQVEEVKVPGSSNLKWILTSLGKQIADAISIGNENPSENFAKKILDNLTLSIPKKNEEINTQITTTHKANVKLLTSIQLDLSKTMGICYSMDYPTIAEKIGFLIQKIKKELAVLDEFRADPLTFYNIKKLGTSASLSSKEKKNLLIENQFLSELIHTQLKTIDSIESSLTNYIETNQSNKIKLGYFNTIFQELSENLRILHHLTRQKSLLETNRNVIKDDDFKKIQKNQVSQQIIENYLPSQIPQRERDRIIQKELLTFISQHIEKDSNSHQFIPLITFYAQFYANIEFIGINIEEVERNLNILAEQKLIVGIRTIVNGGTENYKVIQFTTQDLMEEELRLLRFALETKSFSLTELMDEMEWDKDHTLKILEILTENGLLRHTDSYLHGEKWYLVL